MSEKINWNMVDGYYHDVGITFRWSPSWRDESVIREWDVQFDKDDITYQYQMEFYNAKI